jgi:hypothetical protein
MMVMMMRTMKIKQSMEFETGSIHNSVSGTDWSIKSGDKGAKQQAWTWFGRNISWVDNSNF